MIFLKTFFTTVILLQISGHNYKFDAPINKYLFMIFLYFASYKKLAKFELWKFLK